MFSAEESCEIGTFWVSGGWLDRLGGLFFFFYFRNVKCSD